MLKSIIMLLVEKLFGLVTLGGSIASFKMIQRLLTDAITVIALTIVSGIMSGMLLVCMFYAAFLCLEHYGVEHDTAAFIMMGLAVLATGTIIAITIKKAHELAATPGDHLREAQSLPSRLAGIGDAFVEGVLTRSQQTVKPRRNKFPLSLKVNNVDRYK